MTKGGNKDKSRLQCSGLLCGKESTKQGQSTLGLNLMETKVSWQEDISTGPGETELKKSAQWGCLVIED
jgi:hypothetical protein